MKTFEQIRWLCMSRRQEDVGTIAKVKYRTRKQSKGKVYARCSLNSRSLNQIQ
jgi:hypothetical protein